MTKDKQETSKVVPVPNVELAQDGELKQYYKQEQMFSQEWWREKFRNAKPIGRGAKVLSDEDKLWFCNVTNYRWLRLVVEAVLEKYGDEGRNLIQDVLMKDGEEMGKFFLDVLDIKERDPLALAAIMATGDACWGHNVALKDIASDRSRANFVVSWCGLAASGAATPTLCFAVGPAYGQGMLKAVDPSMEKIEMEIIPGPPSGCFCLGELQIRWKK